MVRHGCDAVQSGDGRAGGRMTRERLVASSDPGGIRTGSLSPRSKRVSQSPLSPPTVPVLWVSLEEGWNMARFFDWLVLLRRGSGGPGPWWEGL